MFFQPNTHSSTIYVVLCNNHKQEYTFPCIEKRTGKHFFFALKTSHIMEVSGSCQKCISAEKKGKFVVLLYQHRQKHTTTPVPFWHEYHKTMKEKP